MTYNAIEVRNLGKSYNIGSLQKNLSPRERIVNMMTLPVRRAKSVFQNQVPEFADEKFWALKDISFDIAQGEVVGVIGRNGAGKSTLLKILTGITKPTEGSARIRGKVGSLLEVGTGFHPELTGRENVYLNGSILGMRRQEIDKRFDEIVEFAEIGKFIDTPIKRYSSGMNVRLAFSVAAHLEPEVLLIDEVLAVGDIAFQKKSLGKIEDVTQSGRTVLFVSHSMASIQDLCPRTIVLQNGQILVDGPTRDVIPQYLESMSASVDTTLQDMPRERNHWGQRVRVIDVNLLDNNSQPTTVLPMSNRLKATVNIHFLDYVKDAEVILGIDTNLGTVVTTTTSNESSVQISGQAGEIVQLELTLNEITLNHGRYFLRVGIRKGNEPLDLIRNARAFEIVEYREENAETIDTSLWGVVKSHPTWRVIKHENTQLEYVD